MDAVAAGDAVPLAGAVAGELALLPPETVHEKTRLAVAARGASSSRVRAPLAEEALGVVADRGLRDIGALLRLAGQGRRWRPT